jgi:hypothetical protein
MRGGCFVQCPLSTVVTLSRAKAESQAGSVQICTSYAIPVNGYICEAIHVRSTGEVSVSLKRRENTIMHFELRVSACRAASQSITRPWTLGNPPAGPIDQQPPQKRLRRIFVQVSSEQYRKSGTLVCFLDFSRVDKLVNSDRYQN